MSEPFKLNFTPTDRGFLRADFEDGADCGCSLYEDHAGPTEWLWLGRRLYPGMHLTRSIAEALGVALLNFAQKGTLATDLVGKPTPMAVYSLNIEIGETGQAQYPDDALKAAYDHGQRDAQARIAELEAQVAEAKEKLERSWSSREIARLKGELEITWQQVEAGDKLRTELETRLSNFVAGIDNEIADIQRGCERYCSSVDRERRAAEAKRDTLKAILQKVEAWLVDDDGPVWRLYRSREIGELNGVKRVWKDVLEDLRNPEVDVLAICEGAPWTAVLLYREIWKALNEASVQTPAPVIVKTLTDQQGQSFCVYLSDGQKIGIERDGGAAWLRIEPTPIVREAEIEDAIKNDEFEAKHEEVERRIKSGARRTSGRIV